MNAREQLIAIYLDWVNNYLSYGNYAEKNGLSLEDATALIILGRKVYESDHPDA